MFNLMHLPKKETLKPQDPKKKAEPQGQAQVSKKPESAGSTFFGIDELKYQSLNDMPINQLGQMADASDLNTARNVRIIATKRYE